MKRNYFWPNVATEDGALWATKQAFWAAVFVAGGTAAVALVAVFGVKVIKGLDASSFVDAALFAAVAFGLRRQSRVAAWAGLVLFLMERVFMVATNGWRGLGVLSVILALGFLGGVRGTSALHRLKRTAALQSSTAKAA